MNFIPYKHGISVFSVTPSGDAGQAINTNFTNIGDYLDGVALLAAATFTGTVTAPSFVGPVTGNCSGTAGGLSANIAESQVTNLTSDLALKAPLASPTFTGTATVQNNTTSIISNTCTSSAGNAVIRCVNDLGNFGEVGKYGSAVAAYGCVSAKDMYFYNNTPASNLCLTTEGTTIKFGIGSSIPEVARLTTTGLGLNCTPATKLDVQGTTTLRNAANTLTTTVIGNAISIGGTATNISVAITPKGTGGLILNDTTGSLVNNLGSGAVDLQASSAKTGTAPAAYSSLLGGNLNIMGASATGSSIIGGASNSTTGGINSTIIAATNVSQSVPSYSLATGQYTAPRTSYGIVQSANDTWTTGTPAQTATIPLIGTTTDSITFVTLKAGGTSINANDNIITVPSNTTLGFTCYIVARSFTALNLTAMFELKGLVDNNGTTTAIIGTVTKTTIADETAGVFTCQAIASAGTLSIQVRGSAGNTVRWSARLTIIEVSGLAVGVS